MSGRPLSPKLTRRTCEIRDWRVENVAYMGIYPAQSAGNVPGRSS